MNLNRVILILVVVIGLSIVGYSLNSALQPASHQIVVQVPQPTATAPLPVLPRPQPEVHYDVLAEQVVPHSGKTIEVYWGDMGQKLIEAGAIDFEAFEQLYGGFSDEQLQILQGDDLAAITFTRENIQFWTNVLWAFGLTQESKVLNEGPMKQNEAEYPLENYASTGGWTIGSKSAVELYSSTRLIALTPEQDDLVYRVAENVFRPCCGNHTAFPDCNHGMAVLGLLELMASQGASEAALYEAALTFNSYAFADTYITIAAYFSLQGIEWEAVDRRRVLGYELSSGQGSRWVVSQVSPIPDTSGQGGSCSPA